LLVGLSGGLRIWRDRQFQSLSRESEKPPFPLSDFPKALGDWQFVEGSETAMDPEVARIAGSSDHLIQSYRNALTGETVSVMILYGLAYKVWAHTPEVCYPSAGFRSIPSSSQIASIRSPDGAHQAPFRKQRFIKAKAGNAILYEAYHSFRNAGRWSPEMEKEWKSFRYHPAMFKVQLQRQPSGSGSDESDAEQLLGRIVLEIERRLSATNPSLPTAKSGATPS
jgi:hypothetical protein